MPTNNKKNHIQIITESEKFNSEELKSYLEPLLYDELTPVEYSKSSEGFHGDDSHSLKAPPPLNRRNSKRDTLSYHTISIFGPQSSGKSTLLNHLFNTKFDTMMSEEYSQCTLGIFLSITDILNQKIFVLDVEGTDSPERQQHGDESQSFEKRVSLFSLAVSEVLLVNMWAKDINRYQASNYSLLKTVFEMNLQLFYQESSQLKTLLLFVLRDYDGFISKEKMIKHIEGHVEKIWESCSKPKGRDNVKVFDLFDLKIEFLPHKVYEPENFQSSIEDLKKRIFNSENDEYIFQSKYHKGVPLAGFDVYTENVWKQIMENKDLNIPAQKEILARFRCSEISEDIMKIFNSKQNEWLQTSKNNLIEDFGKVSKSFVDEQIQQFEELSSLYLPNIVEEYSKDLFNRMKSSLYTVFMNLVTLSRRRYEDKFKTDLQNQIAKAPEKILENFFETTKKLQNEIINSFNKEVISLTFQESDWDVQNILNDLNRKIDDFIQDERSKQLQNQIKKQKEVAISLIDKALQSNKKSGLLFSPQDINFWDEFRIKINEILDDREKILKSLFEEYSCSEEEKTLINEEIESILKTQSKKLIQDYIKFLPSHMNKTFMNQFPPSEISSKSQQQLLESFNTARQKALSVLNTFFLFRDDEIFDDISIIFPNYEEKGASRTQLEYSSPPPEEKVLISDNDVNNFYIDFSHEIEIKLVNAKHEQQRSQMTSIPWWIYIALIVLGWNEIMYVLRNPLILLLIFAVIVIFLWVKFREGVDEFLQNIENPTLRIVLKFFSEFVSQLNTDKKEKKEKEN